MPAADPEGHPIIRANAAPPPEPPRDWRKAPAWEAGLYGLVTSPYDLARTAYHTGMDLATKHPVTGSTFAQAGLPDVTMAKHVLNLATGSQIPTRTAAGDIARAAPAAIPRALSAANDYLYKTYTAPGAWKQTWATHPAQPIMDAVTALTALEQPEALLSRLPQSTARDALMTVPRAAGVARRAIDPVYHAGRALNAGARTVQAGLRGSPLKNGQWTDEAQAAIKKAAPNLPPTAYTPQSPFGIALQTAFKKGVTPEAAGEAMLAYHGAPPSRAVVTRSRAPKAAQPNAQDSITAGKQAVGAKMAQVGGIPEGANGPDPEALGAQVRTAHQTANANRGNLYATAGTNDGVMHPAFSDLLNDNLQQTLATNDFPTTSEGLSNFDYTHSPKALDFLQGQVKALADAGQLTFPKLERIRRRMGDYIGAASGDDRYAVSRMKDGLDQTVQDAIHQGFLGGGDATGAAEDFANARAANQSYMQQFGDDAHPAIKKAVDLGGGSDTGPMSGGKDAAAQAPLAKGLINPQTLAVPPGGKDLYNSLSDALGPDGRPVVDDHIRQTVLATDPETGGLKARPAAVRAFLDGPLGDVFNDGEKDQIRIGASTQDLLNTKPTPGAPGWLGPTVAATLSGGIGALAEHALGGHGLAPSVGEIGPMLAAAGGAGALEHRIVEPIRTAGQIAAELKGAPSVGAWLDPVAAAGATAAKGSLALPAARAANAAAPQPPAQPPPYAPPPGERPDPDWSGSVQDQAPPPGDDAPANHPIVVPNAVQPDQAPPPPTLVAPAPGPPAPKKQPSDGAPPDYDWNQPVEREGHAAGGLVVDMTEHLLRRAEGAQRAAQASTKPLLGLSDDTVAQALRVAQRGI